MCSCITLLIHRQSKGLVVHHKSSFFTPTSWSKFIDEYISLDTIKACNLNNLYWLPADLLISTIVQMPQLEELSIKGTQVCTIRQVAKIMQACPHIVKLDFTYTEKTQQEIWDGLKEEKILLDSFVAGFQKLTSLKMSTTVLDSNDDLLDDDDPWEDDPWVLIIKILT